MARKPPNFEWLGFDAEQAKDLDLLDHLGNNGWARNPQSEAIMPRLILRLDQEVGLDRVKEAMAAIGYSDRALHMLERWYSKATTGKFGR
jgi:hypothetical protein